jgi:hypothetical protein
LQTALMILPETAQRIRRRHSSKKLNGLIQAPRATGPEIQGANNQRGVHVALHGDRPQTRRALEASSSTRAVDRSLNLVESKIVLDML